MANPDAQQPQLSLAKFAPLIMMFLLNKFDLDKLGYRQHAEADFLGVQVGCVWVLSLIEKRIREKPDGESERNPRVKIPAEVVMGKEAKPARDVSQKEYDREKFGELRMQQLMVSFLSSTQNPTASNCDAVLLLRHSSVWCLVSGLVLSPSGSCVLHCKSEVCSSSVLSSV